MISKLFGVGGSSTVVPPGSQDGFAAVAPDIDSTQNLNVNINDMNIDPSLLNQNPSEPSFVNLAQVAPSPQRMHDINDNNNSNSMNHNKQDFDFRLTEGQSRRNAMADCETECSKITDFIHVAGHKVAESWDIISSHSIKRIINCSAAVIPNYFENTSDITYLTLNMVDGRQDDIQWFLPKVVKFIESGRYNNEKTLIHCEKGISRSCSFAIAYIMWSTGSDFRTSFEYVKGCRTVCSPNTGFTCNLLELQDLWSNISNNINKSSSGGGGGGGINTKILRFASHLPHDVYTPVLKWCRNVKTRSLLPTSYSLLQNHPKGVFALLIGGDNDSSNESENVDISGSKSLAAVAPEDMIVNNIKNNNDNNNDNNDDAMVVDDVTTTAGINITRNNKHPTDLHVLCNSVIVWIGENVDDYVNGTTEDQSLRFHENESCINNQNNSSIVPQAISPASSPRPVRVNVMKEVQSLLEELRGIYISPDATVASVRQGHEHEYKNGQFWNYVNRLDVGGKSGSSDASSGDNDVDVYSDLYSCAAVIDPNFIGAHTPFGHGSTTSDNNSNSSSNNNSNSSRNVEMEVEEDADADDADEIRGSESTEISKNNVGNRMADTPSPGPHPPIVMRHSMNRQYVQSHRQTHDRSPIAIGEERMSLNVGSGALGGGIVTPIAAVNVNSNNNNSNSNSSLGKPPITTSSSAAGVSSLSLNINLEQVGASTSMEDSPSIRERHPAKVDVLRGPTPVEELERSESGRLTAGSTGRTGSGHGNRDKLNKNSNDNNHSSSSGSTTNDQLRLPSASFVVTQVTTPVDSNSATTTTALPSLDTGATISLQHQRQQQQQGEVGDDSTAKTKLTLPSTSPPTGNDIYPDVDTRSNNNTHTKRPSKPLLYNLVKTDDGNCAWSAMGIYDDDDLIDEGCFLLLCPTIPDYIWIGSEFPLSPPSIRDHVQTLMTMGDIEHCSPHVKNDILAWLSSQSRGAIPVNHVVGDALNADNTDLSHAKYLIMTTGTETEEFWAAFSDGF